MIYIRELLALENMDELSDMKDELSDRYGSVPSCADNLLMIALIKSKAHKLGMIEIKGGVTSGIRNSSMAYSYDSLS